MCSVCTILVVVLAIGFGLVRFTSDVVHNSTNALFVCFEDGSPRISAANGPLVTLQADTPAAEASFVHDDAQSSYVVRNGYTFGLLDFALLRHSPFVAMLRHCVGGHWSTCSSSFLLVPELVTCPALRTSLRLHPRLAVAVTLSSGLARFNAILHYTKEVYPLLAEVAGRRMTLGAMGRSVIRMIIVAVLLSLLAVTCEALTLSMLPRTWLPIGVGMILAVEWVMHSCAIGVGAYIRSNIWMDVERALLNQRRAVAVAAAPSTVATVAQLPSSDRDVPASTPETECLVCRANERVVAFTPCGHVCVCIACAHQLAQTTLRNCPLCQTPVVSTLRVYGR